MGSPNWFLFLSQLKNALISQKKYALDPVPTQERSKNQLSRNGVTYQLLNLVWLKQISKRLCCIAHYDSTFCLSNFLFGNLFMLKFPKILTKKTSGIEILYDLK